MPDNVTNNYSDNRARHTQTCYRTRRRASSSTEYHLPIYNLLSFRSCQPAFAVEFRLDIRLIV
jgi:hypothetical protein